MQSNSSNTSNSSPLFGVPTSNIQQKPTTNLFDSYPSPPQQLNAFSNINISQNPFQNQFVQHPPVQVQQAPQIQQVQQASLFGSLTGSYQQMSGNSFSSNVYVPQQQIYLPPAPYFSFPGS